MNEYLFRFGYQTPEICDTDFEDSSCVWIVAPDEQTALDWGQEVAQRYIKEQFPGMPGWKESCYASWIETEEEVLRWARTNPVPRCKVGEFPEWSE